RGRGEWAGGVFRMELHPHKVGVTRQFHHFHSLATRILVYENHPRLLEPVNEVWVDLVSVAVPLEDGFSTVQPMHDAPSSDKVRLASANPHSAAQITASVFGHLDDHT